MANADGNADCERGNCESKIFIAICKVEKIVNCF